MKLTIDQDELKKILYKHFESLGLEVALNKYTGKDIDENPLKDPVFDIEVEFEFIIKED